MTLLISLVFPLLSREVPVKRFYTTTLSFASLALAALLFFAPLASAQSWSGTCVAVTDGDTITVMRDREPIKIRLYGIDCPEKKQPFGTRAKQFASDMVFGKMGDVEPVTTDRYGRTVA